MPLVVNFTKNPDKDSVNSSITAIGLDERQLLIQFKSKTAMPEDIDMASQRRDRFSFYIACFASFELQEIFDESDINIDDYLADLPSNELYILLKLKKTVDEKIISTLFSQKFIGSNMVEFILPEEFDQLKSAANSFFKVEKARIEDPNNVGSEDKYDEELENKLQQQREVINQIREEFLSITHFKKSYDDSKITSKNYSVDLEILKIKIEFYKKKMDQLANSLTKIQSEIKNIQMLNTSDSSSIEENIPINMNQIGAPRNSQGLRLLNNNLNQIEPILPYVDLIDHLNVREIMIKNDHADKRIYDDLLFFENDFDNKTGYEQAYATERTTDALLRAKAFKDQFKLKIQESAMQPLEVAEEKSSPEIERRITTNYSRPKKLIKTLFIEPSKVVKDKVANHVSHFAERFRSKNG